MDKKVTKFDDTEIEEYKFHQPRSAILINGINVNKIVVSNKQKYTVDNDKIEIYSDEKIQTKKIKYIKLFLAKIFFSKIRKM